jgi:hypothetical protein
MRRIKQTSATGLLISIMEAPAVVLQRQVEVISLCCLRYAPTAFGLVRCTHLLLS